MSEGQIEIAIDAMGGENSPYKVLKGAEIFLQKEKQAKLVFFGNKELIHQSITKNNLSIFNLLVCGVYKINKFVIKFS